MAKPVWAWGAAVAVLAAAALVAVAVRRPPPDFAGESVVAMVRDGAAQPVWAIRLDGAAHEIAADAQRPMPAPPGHAYQLWLDGPAGRRSLGMLPAQGRTIIALTPDTARRLAAVGTLGVTLEAADGSATGRPIGATLFRGRLGGPN